jgi:hypothetical protein
MGGTNGGNIFVIFSVDTEHDIVGRYATRSAGWSRGLPLLFETFDAAGMKGKVCWLIEYNVIEGVPAANPNSVFYSPEFLEMVEKIRKRHDEVGLHPSMVDWVGRENLPTALSYVDPAKWDDSRRLHDAEFVSNIITSAAAAVSEACGSTPVGCRTGGMQYATHLGRALLANKIYVDSSVAPSGKHTWNVHVPKAYYASSKDIRKPSDEPTSVLEIPTAGYVQNGLILDTWMKLRCRFWMRHPGPVFLSFFIHNWQAVMPNRRTDSGFLNTLGSFLRLLDRWGAKFLSWSEAHEAFRILKERKGEFAGISQRSAGL